MVGYLHRVLVLLAWSGATATAIAQTAATTPCTQGLVIPTAGTTASARIVVCSEVERQVPQLRQMIEKLLQGQAAAEERTREVERLLRNVNGAAARVEGKQIALAKALAEKLSEANAQGDAGALRSVRRLSDDIEEANEKIARAAAAKQNAEATAALKAAIDDALAALDLAKVSRLVESIEALQRQLSGVERKIDVVAENTDESRNTTIFAEALRSKSRGDLGQVRVLAAFVKQGKTFDGQNWSGVGFPAVQAAGLRAPGADLSQAWFTGADLARADLTNVRAVATVLERARLPQARLHKLRGTLVDAQGADLQGADLSLASLTASDLRGADLRGANLKGASLQHTDLRNADLRGANLAGAVLRNADLRGAKLGDAQFANTEAAGAVIERAQLSAAQWAGLCATPDATERGQRWDVVERVPSSRFDGGYQYVKIYDERWFGGHGTHRPYPRCKVRAKEDLSPWDQPIVSHGDQEYWNESFGFQVDHAQLEGGGRRAELLSRMRAAHAVAKDRPSLLPSLSQYAEVRQRLVRALDERQRELVARLAPAAPLAFDTDTGVLLALRLRPAVIAEAGGLEPMAASHGGFGDYQGQARGHGKPWPKLFPQGLLRDDLSDATTRAWEAWTQARARSLRSNEVLVGAGSGLANARSWADAIVFESYQGRSEPQLARQLGVDAANLVVFRERHSFAAAARRAGTAFIVEGDLAAIRHRLKDSGKPPPELLAATVTDVQFVRGDPAHGPDVIVWTLQIRSPS